MSFSAHWNMQIANLSKADEKIASLKKELEAKNKELESLQEKLDASKESITAKDEEIERIRAAPVVETSGKDKLELATLKEKVAFLEERRHVHATTFGKVKSEARGLFAAVLLQQDRLKKLVKIAAYIANWDVAYNPNTFVEEVRKVKTLLTEASDTRYLNSITECWPTTEMGQQFQFHDIITVVCRMKKDGCFEPTKTNESTYQDIWKHQMTEIYDRLTSGAEQPVSEDAYEWLLSAGDASRVELLASEDEYKWLLSTGDEVRRLFDNASTFDAVTGDFVSADASTRFNIHQPRSAPKTETGGHQQTSTRAPDGSSLLPKAPPAAPTLPAAATLNTPHKSFNPPAHQNLPKMRPAAPTLPENALPDSHKHLPTLPAIAKDRVEPEVPAKRPASPALNTPPPKKPTFVKKPIAPQNGTPKANIPNPSEAQEAKLDLGLVQQPVVQKFQQPNLGSMTDSQRQMIAGAEPKPDRRPLPQASAVEIEPPKTTMQNPDRVLEQTVPSQPRSVSTCPPLNSTILASMPRPWRYSPVPRARSNTRVPSPCIGLFGPVDTSKPLKPLKKPLQPPETIPPTPVARQATEHTDKSDKKNVPPEKKRRKNTEKDSADADKKQPGKAAKKKKSSDASSTGNSQITASEDATARPANPAPRKPQRKDLDEDEMDKDEMLAYVAAREAMNAAAKHFADLDRVQLFFNTKDLLQKHKTLKSKHKYVLYKNMARALYIYENEYAQTHEENYALDGPIPETILGRWLADSTSPIPRSWLLSANLCNSNATDEDLERYSIAGVPDMPQLHESNYPKPW